MAGEGGKGKGKGGSVGSRSQAKAEANIAAAVVPSCVAVHTISVMNVQIRAPSAKPERHPQLHARRNVAPGVFALSAVSLHECPYFL